MLGQQLWAAASQKAVTGLAETLVFHPSRAAPVLRASCITAGVVYPVYRSFHALESADSKDDPQWLTYWICFGAFSLLEQHVDRLQELCPYYYHCKLAFLLYLQLPNTQGARVLYLKYLRPVFQRVQPKVDLALSRAYDMVLALYRINAIPINAAISMGWQMWAYLKDQVKAAEADKDKGGSGSGAGGSGSGTSGSPFEAGAPKAAGSGKPTQLVKGG